MPAKYRKGHPAVGLAIAAVVVAVLVTPFIWFWYQTRPYESNDRVEMEWSVSGKRYLFSCTVVDTEGNPLSNVRPSFLSTSGWTPSGVTNDEGFVEVKSGEPDWEAVMINNVVVMRRQYAYWLNQPNVDRGLNIRIVIKDKSLLTAD